MHLYLCVVPLGLQLLGSRTSYVSTPDSQDVYLRRACTRQKLIKLISFSKLVSEVTRHHLYCIKSIRNESPNSVHFQEKGILTPLWRGGVSSHLWTYFQALTNMTSKISIKLPSRDDKEKLILSSLEFRLELKIVI